MTVISAAPCALPELAVIVAVPSATPVTKPDASTVATSASLDSHENSAPATICPFTSNASAVSCSVAPRTIVSTDGDTSTEATGSGTRTTVTSAVPCALPELAVIVAIPSATAVTRPEAFTVATELALLVQVTMAPAMTLEFWSRTSALSCTVAPNAASSAMAGITDIVVGRGGSGTGSGAGAVVLSPPQPHTKDTPVNIAHTRCMVR